MKKAGNMFKQKKILPLLYAALISSSCAYAGIALDKNAETLTQMTGEEGQIDALLAQMSLDQKVAQLIMPDISAVTTQDIAKYQFGTILNGGNSGPYGNEKASPENWLALADEFWVASTAPRADGGPAIPILWATDGVHGHSNIGGATIFPHNIGLGATRNPELIRKIGQVTAAEIAVTGIDWTFAPTLAVVRDDRWGRTYESFSEDSALVTKLGVAMVEGLQGTGEEFLNEEHVIATAKHFFADGGTAGRDTGDSAGDEQEILNIHAAPYRPALQAGAQSVMASFSSINGKKMHGSKEYLTDLLKRDMAFDGLVVGDWNGHGRVEGCSNIACSKSLNAGLDIFMVPEDWKALMDNTISQVKSGEISNERLDDAVRRVLRVKTRYGLFDKPRPSARKLGGKFELLGSPEHRAVARDAVRQSMVLLKNNGVLPLKPSSNILVAGTAADDIAQQSGGWSISWQGGADLTNADFPGAQSIYDGISEQVAAAGGTATLSVDGTFTGKPDAAIVIFGEQPYAEYLGDLRNLIFQDIQALELIRRFKEQDIPVVAVFLSGRPLWVNRELNSADAFVAAWLPGSEGGGVADILLQSQTGGVQYDFTGKLPFSWPQQCNQYSLNMGDDDYDPLFPFGFGLNYMSEPGVTGPLHEVCNALNQNLDDGVSIMKSGQVLAPYGMFAVAGNGNETAIMASRGQSSDGALKITPRDRNAQEDARHLVWQDAASFKLVRLGDQEFAKGKNRALVIEYNVTKRPSGQVNLSVSCGQDCQMPIDISADLALAEGKGWRTANISLRCFGDETSLKQSIEIRSKSAFEMMISSARLVDNVDEVSCQF